MLPKLTPVQARVLGCLMEKSVVTPDQYPLTLNALTNACNQKSSRDPVMSLDQGEVQRTTRELRDEHLVQIDENMKTGVEKYKQRLCNTSFSDFQFDPAQFAVITLLLLRGPQTPGELRTRSGRLHAFEDNDAVIETLSSLIHRGGSDPLVVKLPRQPGRKDSEYAHLLGDPDAKSDADQASGAKTKTADAPPPAKTAETPPPVEKTTDASPARAPKTTEAPARAKPDDTTTGAKTADKPPPAKTAESAPPAKKPADTQPPAGMRELTQRVENLEAELAKIKALLKALL